MAFHILMAASRFVTVTNDDGHIWNFHFPDGYETGPVPCEPIWKDGKEPEDPMKSKSAEAIALAEAKRQEWF